jgi:hypothetical protein
MEVKSRKPPGRKLLKNISLRTKWLICSIGGLLLIGYGLSVFSEAGHLKHTGADTQKWVLLGTYSLVIINAGISIFGQGVIFKMMMENRKFIKRMFKERDRKTKKPRENFD